MPTRRTAVSIACSALATLILLARPAAAQQVAFERTLTVPAAARLDAATFRGSIQVTAGAAGRIVVRGTVTGRGGATGTDRAALATAQRLAAQPPVSQDGATVRVRPPASADDRRAVTIDYRVEVPPDTEVVTVSDAGAVSVARVTGRVSVTTQSGAIALADLGGRVQVTSASGAVRAERLKGELDVTTESGPIDAQLTGGYELSATSESGIVTATGVVGSVTRQSVKGRLGKGGRHVELHTRSGAVRVR